MKPIIAIDFNGALLKSRPFDEAHKRWFKLFSILLEDDTINDWAGKENYFEGIHDVMKRYLGDSDKMDQNVFARQVYAMVLVAEVKKSDLILEFADYLRSIKEHYSLALITTAPKGSVIPILHKLHCNDIFDIVFSSSTSTEPDKRALFEEFVSQHGTPLIYIGQGDKDLGSLRALNMKTISVNWVSRGKFKGDHDIETFEELKNIIYLN